MSLTEIEALPKDVLLPTDVAEYLACDPHYIRMQARAKPELLGFPVIVIGNRTKIPKEAFVNWCRKGGRLA
ncbi:MAG: hypothetical protein CVU91_07305 [Firmicutes bacterium HGW-Firmicutes-16]|nr:MAG: hypothetical protein CVU91_07305 [Firmicutes bacterium HGW-Firmicutes-16]